MCIDWWNTEMLFLDTVLTAGEGRVRLLAVGNRDGRGSREVRVNFSHLECVWLWLIDLLSCEKFSWGVLVFALG